MRSPVSRALKNADMARYRLRRPAAAYRRQYGYALSGMKISPVNTVTGDTVCGVSPLVRPRRFERLTA